LLAVVALFFFAPQTPVRPDETWTRIQNERVLRIGIDPSSPPFIVDDGTGRLSGFDVALAQDFADTWGVQVQYVYTGYDGLYDALNAKQFDLILSALPYNPNKTQDVYFSRAYFNGGPILVVRGDDTATAGLQDLRGKTLAVELGSNGDAAARRWQKRYALSLQQKDTAFDALRALQARTVDAVVTDPISIYDFQRAEADTGAKSWRVVGKPLADENYVIAVRRDSPTLLQQINARLDTLRGSGALEQMQRENF
jgi:ABC-type amino acid transport substrate-binding protein